MNANPAQSPVIGGKSVELFMKITWGLEFESGAVIEAPEGLRLKIKYADYAAGGPAAQNPWKVDAKAGPCHQAGAWPSALPPDSGRVLSGGDWVLVRRDGVIVLDARVTLGFPAKTDPTDVYLVDMTLKGTIDLARSFNTVPANAFDWFVAGSKACSAHDVIGSARFEAADIAAAGSDTTWLPEHLLKSSQRFPDFAPLVRQQFLAVGTVKVASQKYYPPSQIDLEIWGRQAY
jgi:hypothetical protein